MNSSEKNNGNFLDSLKEEKPEPKLSSNFKFRIIMTIILFLFAAFWITFLIIIFTKK